MVLDRLISAVGRGIERAVEDAILDAFNGIDTGEKRRKGCIRAWLNEFREHPGGVHLVIGKQRSGKTALCYFLAQKTGRKPIYAMTAAREVLPGVEVIYDIDVVPPGSVLVVDDASLFFNSMRTKKTDDNYQLLRDLLIFAEKQDLCVLFNAHDTSLLNKTAFSQAKAIIFKEPNLMALDTERPGIRKIMEHVQQGFNRIKKGQREEYFFLYSSDCRGWGKNPLPSGWSQKVSISCRIMDAEFRDIKEGEEREGDIAKSKEFMEFQEQKKEMKETSKREKELKEFEEWRKNRESGESFEEFKRNHEKGSSKDNQDNRRDR